MVKLLGGKSTTKHISRVDKWDYSFPPNFYVKKDPNSVQYLKDY